MFETGKAVHRRLRDPNFLSRYFVGEGVDIGSGPDPLTYYAQFFPLLRSCRAWDINDGDAQLMNTVADSTFDFVNSSHCLEHLEGPEMAVINWWRILRPGGHLVVVVPDEDMYEQGVWPSQYNTDHKHSFTTYKTKSWCPASINVFELLMLLNNADIIKVERLTATYHQNAPGFDQTLTILGECAIEFVVRKLQ